MRVGEIKIGLFHAQSTVKEQTFVSPVFSDDKRIKVEPYQATQPVFSFVFFLHVLHKLGQNFFFKEKSLEINSLSRDWGRI
jgi:hypothetical protein